MAPRIVNYEEEPYRNFKSRMRDKYGIVVNREVLRHAAYEQAVTNLEADFIFADRQIEYGRLKRLHYGLGFDSFIEQNTKILEEDEELENENELAEDTNKEVAEDKKKKLTKNERKELIWRNEHMAESFLFLEERYKEMSFYIDTLDQPSIWFSRYEEQEDFEDFEDLEDFEEPDIPDLFYDRPNDIYTFNKGSKASADMVPVDRVKLRDFLRGQNEEGQRHFWESVHLDGILSVTSYRMVTMQLQRDLKRLEQELPYGMNVLSKVQDYRVMLGLRYLIELAKQAGIRSKMEPVLSFPLGSNVTTLLEVVRMYEGLVTGDVALPGEPGEGNQDLLTVLDRIESVDGELLYKPNRIRRNVVAPEVSVSIGHVLENTVKFGTGRYANKNVKISYSGKSSDQAISDMALAVPVLGKTGTANRYTNAAFIGYLPGVAEERDAMSIDGGYAVGVYVGYDDNKVMRKGAMKVTGAAGALPTWTDIINALLEEKGYGEKLDPVDLSFNGLILKQPKLGQLNLAADVNEGGKLKDPLVVVDKLSRYRPSIKVFGRRSETGQLIEDRRLRLFIQQPKFEMNH